MIGSDTNHKVSTTWASWHPTPRLRVKLFDIRNLDTNNHQRQPARLINKSDSLIQSRRGVELTKCNLERILHIRLLIKMFVKFPFFTFRKRKHTVQTQFCSKTIDYCYIWKRGFNINRCQSQKLSIACWCVWWL